MQAAEIAGVGVRTIQRAKNVLDQGSAELVDAMKSEKVAIRAAAEIAG
ncbi:hypothetical protein CCP3SC5AM1_3570001 [Gammaproteobacteria bacterium]